MAIEITKFPALEYSATEAFNTLCTNLSFFGINQNCIMVTSCVPNEGKTFVAMNLMRSLTKLGKTVTLIDADLRKSVIQERYEMVISEDAKHGLAHYLAGMCDMEDVVQRTNLSGAYFVPVGVRASNSLTLLNSGRISELIERLSQSCDYVIVDAPPVGTVIDAAEIAKSCTGTLFVVKENEIRRRMLREAKLQIARAGCEVLGAVMNQVEFGSYANKKYYKRGYYYSRYEKKK